MPIAYFYIEYKICDHGSALNILVVRFRKKFADRTILFAKIIAHLTQYNVEETWADFYIDKFLFITVSKSFILELIFVKEAIIEQIQDEKKKGSDPKIILKYLPLL